MSVYRYFRLTQVRKDALPLDAARLSTLNHNSCLVRCLHHVTTYPTAVHQKHGPLPREDGGLLPVWTVDVHRSDVQRDAASERDDSVQWRNDAEFSQVRPDDDDDDGDGRLQVSASV